MAVESGTEEARGPAAGAQRKRGVAKARSEPVSVRHSARAASCQHLVAASRPAAPTANGGGAREGTDGQPGRHELRLDEPAHELAASATT